MTLRHNFETVPVTTQQSLSQSLWLLTVVEVPMGDCIALGTVVDAIVNFTSVYNCWLSAESTRDNRIFDRSSDNTTAFKDDFPPLPTSLLYRLLSTHMKWLFLTNVNVKKFQKWSQTGTLTTEMKNSPGKVLTSISNCL